MDVESSLKQLGNEALHDLYQNLTGAKQFVLEQAPDVCRQIIAWQVAQAVIAAVLAIALSVATVFAVRWAVRDARKNDGVPDPPAFFVAAFTGIAAIGANVAMFCDGSEAIKALVAPKLFLIEYIARLIK